MTNKRGPMPDRQPGSAGGDKDFDHLSPEETRLGLARTGAAAGRDDFGGALCEAGFDVDAGSPEPASRSVGGAGSRLPEGGNQAR